MIELNGVYKLKKIQGFENNDNGDYKVLAILEKNIVVCENEYGEHYYFMKDFLIDPEFILFAQRTKIASFCRVHQVIAYVFPNPGSP